MSAFSGPLQYPEPATLRSSYRQTQAPIENFPLQNKASGGRDDVVSQDDPFRGEGNRDESKIFVAGTWNRRTLLEGLESCL